MQNTPTPNQASLDPFLSTTGSSAEVDLRNLESFILSSDRSQFIKNLIPGTTAHSFFRILHLLNTEQKLSPEDIKALEKFNKQQSSNDSNCIYIKSILQRLDDPKIDAADKKKLIDELNKKYISYKFDYAKPSNVETSKFEVNEQKLASKLDQNLISGQEIFDNAYTDIENFVRLDRSLYTKLSTQKILNSESEQIISLFTARADPIDFENTFPKFLAEAKKKIKNLAEDSNEFFELLDKLYRRFTLTQLKEVGKLFPELISRKSYVNALFHKEFKLGYGALLGAGYNPHEQREFFQRAYQWGKGQKTYQEQVSRYALYYLLKNATQTDKYDKSLFLEYLKKPIDVTSHANSTTANKMREERVAINDSWTFFKRPNGTEMNQVLEDHLRIFFKTEKTIDAFTDYFDSYYLNRIFAEVKLMEGGDIKNFTAFYDSNQIKALSERKELKVAKSNKTVFHGDESVEIGLYIKNISSLMIKIFEFCPENYYLKQKRNIDETMNLEGLVASEEFVEEIKEAPLKRINRSFSFPSIQKKKQGVFIIDFIGNGLSARAVIYKGTINYIEDHTASGQVFTLIDEQKKILTGKKTGMWIGNRFHTVDEKGRVIIPYGKSQRTEKAVIVNGDFAELRDVTLKTESYNFGCSFLYNHESMIMGNKASVILHPVVTLNTRPIGVDVINKVKITATTYNEQNMPTNNEFKDKIFAKNEDLQIDFPIPAKLKKVEIKVEVQIPPSDGSDPKIFNQNHTISFNTYSSSNEICNTYLKYTENGYDLYILGKTGEPRKNVPVSLKFEHSLYKKDFNAQLQTDEQGRVQLGKLPQINSFQAQIKELGDIQTMTRTWNVNQSHKINYPSKVTLCKGDKLNLPVLHNQVDNSKLQYFEVRNHGGKQNTIENLLSELKVDKYILTVEAKQIGTYVLKLRDVDHKITIEVINANPWKHSTDFLEKKDCLLNLRNELENIVIRNYDVKVNKENKDLADIEVNVYADEPEKARFHIFGQQFLRNDTIRCLDQLNSKAPSNAVSKEITTKIKTSVYYNDKNLGDEYQYVLDRKNKTRYIGNTLEKPPLLASRNFVRDTQTQQENLSVEGSFHRAEFDDFLECEKREKRPKMLKGKKACGGKPMATKAKKRYVNRRAASISSGEDVDSASDMSDLDDIAISEASGITIQAGQFNNVDSFLNFLTNPTLVQSNLKPKNGKFIIKDFPINKYAYIEVIGTNGVRCISDTIPLTDNALSTRNLTLKSQLQSDKFYSTNRATQTMQKGDNYIIKDMTSTDMNVVDSIAKLFDVQKVLKLSQGSDSENGGYDFWSFLRDWNTLPIEDKLKNYDKYASHEVNIFLYFKDRAFFDENVKPFIRNKIKKQVIDYALLGDEKALLPYAKSSRFNSLNVLEKCLLMQTLRQSHPDVVASMAGYFETYGKGYKLDSKTYNLFFDCILNSKANDKKISFKPQDDEKEPPMLQPKADMLSSGSNSLDASYCEDIAEEQLRYSDAELSVEDMYEQNCMNDFENNFEEEQYFDDDEEDDDSDFSGGPPIRQMANRNRNRNAAPRGLRRRGSELMYSNADLNVASQKRKPMRGGFKEAENAKEYTERNYYGIASETKNMKQNPFWVDLAQHIAKNGLEKPFLTSNFLYATYSHTEMISVMALLSLPFKAESHNYQSHESRGLKIDAASNLVIFFKEIALSASDIKPEILVTQRFFDPKDRYQESEEEAGLMIEKEIDQYVINKIYGYQVIVTNGRAANQEFQVLVEIPEGSIPVKTLDYTKSHTLSLASHMTKTIDTFFYFPMAAKRTVKPCNVSKNGKVLALGKEYEFDVHEKRVFKDLETLNAVLSQGSQDDILKFIQTKNIFDPKVFKYTDIYWLLKDKTFFNKLLDVLRSRRAFDAKVWSFGIYHQDYTAIRELLEATPTNGVARYLNYQKSSFIEVDKLSLLEYHPHINTRVHQMSNEKEQIMNNQLNDQYKKFMRYLAEVPKLDTPHYLGLTYYMLLQDRIEEAIIIFKKISQDNIKKTHEHELQYDYFAAYIDFYTGYPNFKVAREVCLRYVTYPVLSWRALFIDILNQLAEFDGDEMIEDDLIEESEKKKKEKDVNKEELVTMDLEKTKLNISYKNIDSITLSIFKIDLEILFSRNPFLSQSKDDFAFVQPNHVHDIQIKKSNELEKATYEIPPNLQTSNLFIQLRANNKTLHTTYFSTSLQTQLIENYGQIKITDKDEPLTKVYVKCFAKNHSGNVTFYKDGYSDLRGRFDYATLNSGDVSQIEKFALFVMSDEFGSLIVEAKPPKTIGKVESNLVIKSKEQKYADYYMNDIIQQELEHKYYDGAKVKASKKTRY